MRTITIQLDDDYYTRYERLAARIGKTVEEYAKQCIENKTDTFSTEGYRGGFL